MKMRAVIGACVIMLGWCHVGSAGLIVGFDMDLSQSGVQAHREVLLGDEFDVGVVLVLPSDIALVAYEFSMRFNSDALSFIGRENTPPDPPLTPFKGGSWSLAFGSNDPDLGPGNYGQLDAFEALSLTGQLDVPGLYQVGKLTFQAIAVPDPATPIQLVAGVFTGDDGFFGFTGPGKIEDLYESELVEFQPGSFSVVPEPTSLALFGTALCAGLAVMLTRRRHARHR